MFNTSKKTEQTQCDICGKKNTKIQRRYRNEGYCPNCYRTWFIKKPCFNCDKNARLHKKIKHACCSDCIRRQSCQRCGADAYKNGANTKYGRVCAGCYAYYFAKKKTCFECKKEKAHVSRYSELAHDYPVCISCYQKHTHASCQSCGRTRKLLETPKGKICKKCNEFGEVVCKQCHKKYPAGYGKICSNCYWENKLLNETFINNYLFKNDKLRDEYNEFIQWLLKSLGPQRACLNHNNYIDFFILCQTKWGGFPSYEVLVTEFKPQGLRFYLSVLRWLVDSDRVVIDEKIKLDVAEQSYIEKALSVFTVVPVYIDRYYQHLIEKQAKGKISMRTARLALRPVISMYTKFELLGSNTPSDEQFKLYLEEKKGQYNSLLGFVSFLRKEHGLQIVYNKPKHCDVVKANRKSLEDELIRLANLPKPLSRENELDWYQTAMAVFHNIHVTRKNFSKVHLNTADEMIRITYQNGEYWIPNFEFG